MMIVRARTLGAVLFVSFRVVGANSLTGDDTTHVERL